MDIFKNIKHMAIASCFFLIACKSEPAEAPADEHADDEASVVELSPAQVKTAEIVLGKSRRSKSAEQSGQMECWTFRRNSW